MENILKKYIRYIVILGVLCFIICLFISIPVTLADYWSCLGYSISATTLLFMMYVKYLWRWNPLEKTPKLKKRYTANIISTYDGIVRQANVIIKQTLMNTRIYMDTSESHSYSLSSTIFNNHGEVILLYGYINEPKAIVRDKSTIHYGMALFRLNNVVKIEGFYFNDRKTTGDIILTAIEK